MMLQKIKNIVEYEITGRDYLKPYQDDILHISNKLTKSFMLGNRLYICGNGGSSADASHIASEFIKDFNIKRIATNKTKNYPSNKIQGKLQKGFPAFSLSDPAIITAISNDIDYSLIYAQQIYAYGNVGDVLILLSTSGNSENVINAAITASEIGVYTIGFTGKKENELHSLCSYGVKVDYPTTARIQEGYMSILHTVCAVVEKIIYQM